MSGTTSTVDPVSTADPVSAGAVVDHREYDATVEIGYEGEAIPDPDSEIKFQFSWRKLWRVRACKSNRRPGRAAQARSQSFKPGRLNQHGQ